MRTATRTAVACRALEMLCNVVAELQRSKPLSLGSCRQQM